jgi:putative transposase
MVICHRYRVLPRKSQHRALERILESQRQLYNAALEERIGAYRTAGLSVTYFDQTRGLTEWRRGDPEARVLPVNLQRATLKRLDIAYQRFFCRVMQGGAPGFPRFRGKGWFHSFGFREFEGITLDGGRLRFKGMRGWLRVHWHRDLPKGSAIKSCTFKRDPKGWSVSFAISVPPASARHGERAVGIDLGISTFAALSNGGFIPSLRAARKAERRLRIAQRALARKARRSAGRHQARRTLARCHAAVARRRREHLHQASARLVRENDVIVVEQLNVKGLARSAMAKDVHDASWARFISMLRYKAERAGARLIEVDSRNTSQECSGCGKVVPKCLSDRRHECPHCGLSLDRDLNAARNVLNRAGVGPSLRNVAGCGMRAGENLVSDRWAGQQPVTPS